MTVSEVLQICRQRLLAGQVAEAQSICRQVLSQYPDHADALFLLATAAQLENRLSDAIDLLRRVAAIRPGHAEAGTLLGNLLHMVGKDNEAIEAYRKVLLVRPNHVDAEVNIGNILKIQGRSADAVAAYRRAIALAPNHPHACNNLGAMLNEMGKSNEAIEFYKCAIAARPQFVEAHRNLGNALLKLSRHEEALARYHMALQLQPNHSATHHSIGDVFLAIGRIQEAIASYRRAVQFSPDSPRLLSSLLVHLYLHPGYDSQAICAEHDLFEIVHARSLSGRHSHRSIDSATGRPLRIGYVSPDFRDHPTSYFTSSLLSAHDASSVEIFCYSDVSIPDAVTRKLRSFPHTWRDIVGLSDEEAADSIAADGIDILVDLALHAAGGRPLLFARKPAPIQVTWLGYPGTTGLAAMDYQLTDSHIDPPGENDHWQTEQLVRLPDTSLCYDPGDTQIAVGPPPIAANGRVAFGCLNNFCKVNDLVLRLFSQVLNAVNGSTLLLAAPKGMGRRRVLDAMSAEGVEASRIEFIEYQPTWRELMQLYHRIDIALDTFPWNGHTTSLEALWMGVPVVSLRGQTAVSRAGACYLSNLGLADLVADTPGRFIEIAARLAGDAPRLSQLRSTLRQAMEASPLMNKQTFARNVEAAYRWMWRQLSIR